MHDFFLRECDLGVRNKRTMIMIARALTSEDFSPLFFLRASVLCTCAKMNDVR